MQKQEKMEYVAEHVLKIIQLRGLSGVTYAQVAKSAGVSRAWLYKYVGQTKEDLIQFAVAHFGRIYSELDRSVSNVDREGYIDHAIDSLGSMFDLTRKYPWVLPLYFRYTGTRTIIGETLQHLERLYFDKVTREIDTYMKPKHMDAKTLAEALASFNLGVALRIQNNHGSDADYRKEVLAILRTFLGSVT